MKNEPKTDVLLHMMEQPERYTEEQWRDILSDSECRELYTLMALTRGSVAAAKADAALTDEEIEGEWEKVMKVKNEGVNFRSSESNQARLNCRVVTKVSEAKSEKYTLPEESDAVHEGNSYFTLFTFHFSLKKIAAIFLAAVFLGGLAWAFVPLLRPKEEASPTAEVTTLPLGEQGGGLLSFANVRLDSILTVVAGHYGLEVSFRDEAPRELRFTVTWNRRLPIASFVSSLNEFDGLLLTEERDTLFVESVETAEEE